MYIQEYLDPVWQEGGRVHNWKNYPSDRVKDLWPTFSDEKKLALAEMFDDMASGEEWE